MWVDKDASFTKLCKIIPPLYPVALIEGFKIRVTAAVEKVDEFGYTVHVKREYRDTESRSSHIPSLAVVVDDRKLLTADYTWVTDAVWKEQALTNKTREVLQALARRSIYGSDHACPSLTASGEEWPVVGMPQQVPQAENKHRGIRWNQLETCVNNGAASCIIPVSYTPPPPPPTFCHYTCRVDRPALQCHQVWCGIYKWWWHQQQFIHKRTSCSQTYAAAYNGYLFFFFFLNK